MESEAETGMSDMPPLNPIADDDGESEDVIDEPEAGEPIDESDTDDDDPDEEDES